MTNMLRYIIEVLMDINILYIYIHMHALCACCVCVRSNKRLHLEGVNEVILTLEHELREPCR